MAEGEGGSFFGPGKKRMSKETFKAYLFWAIAIDIIFGWWLPGAGTVFVGVCYGTWWLHGYNIDKLGTKAGISAVCGFVPFLELVSNIVFVCVAYADNVKNTAASELGIAANKPEDEKTPGADNLLRQNNGDTQGTSVQGRDASNQKTDNLVRKNKDEAVGSTLGKKGGEMAGTVAGEAVGGPVGASVGGKVGGAVGSRLGDKAAGSGSSGGTLKDAPTQKTDNLVRKNKDEAVGTSVQGRDAPTQKTDNLLRNNTDEAIGTPVRGQGVPEAKHAYEPRQPVFRAQPLYNRGEDENDTSAPSDSSDEIDSDEPDELTNSPQPEENENGGDFDTFDNVKRVA